MNVFESWFLMCDSKCDSCMITLSHGSQSESCTSLSLVVPSGSLEFSGVLWGSQRFLEFLREMVLLGSFMFQVFRVNYIF